MDEVSVRAEVADAVGDSHLAVSVPRNEVERILATEEEVDLVLDVVRTNGEREERRIFLAWDREALRHLVDQGGERSIVAIDPDSLQKALDADVEAHGLREMGATLAIAVTALGGAGAAGAAVAEGAYEPFVTDFPSVEATVDTSTEGAYQPFVTDFPSIEATVDMSSGWQAAAEESGYGERGTPSDVAADSGGSREVRHSRSRRRRLRFGAGASPSPRPRRQEWPWRGCRGHSSRRIFDRDLGTRRDTLRADIGRVDRMNAPAAQERPGARQQEVES
jgi:hypothetical protein